MSHPCPSCGTDNRLVARFCKHCAAALTPVVPPPPAPQPATAARVFCTSCGKPNTAQARFCRACGTAMTGLEAAVPPVVEPPLSVPAALQADQAPGGQPRWPVLLAMLALLVLLAATAFWWQQRNTATLTPAARAEPIEEILVDAQRSPVTPAEPPTALIAPTAPAVAAAPEPPPVAAPVDTVRAPAAAAPAPTATARTAAPPRTAPPAAAAPVTAPPPARNRAPEGSVAVASPEASCADRNNFTRPFCVSVQCFKSEFRRHPTCLRLADEARQRRQYEQDHNLSGG